MISTTKDDEKARLASQETTTETSSSLATAFTVYSTTSEPMAASTSLQTDPIEKAPESVLSNLGVAFLGEEWDLPNCTMF
jgi:hypothetical protein